MKVGIDASNLREGGGVTHLREILRSITPHSYDYKQVIVWGGSTTLERLEERPWLHKIREPLLDQSLPYRLYWQRFVLKHELQREDCDILFAPGGSVSSDIKPNVTMFRNMLPFERRERDRYGKSWLFIKMILIKYVQMKTFMAADGIIFLTQYARNTLIKEEIRLIGINNVIIPHGIDKRFLLAPRLQKSLNFYSYRRPFRILCVSIIEMYKHQWHVVNAIAQLKKKGFHITLQLVGGAYPPALKRLYQEASKYPNQEEFIHYTGAIDYNSLHEVYHNADLFVFASSCENMPNILLEAMASGLPIACSNRGPMPEILGKAGVYFDPENPTELAETLEKFVYNNELRERCAWRAYTLARNFSWKKCAQETFSFINSVAKDFKKHGTRRKTHI